MFRSSTSSSRAFLRDITVALVALAALEVFLAGNMAVFERRGGDDAVVKTVADDGPAHVHVLGSRDPLAFFATLAGRLQDRPFVFVGDSQGAGAHGGGDPYPLQFAARLREAGRNDPVVSMHKGGANAHEQAVLLLAMLDAGIEPRCVIWAHSIFSQRKNQVRGELAGAYRSVEANMARLAPDAVVVGVVEPEAPGGDPAQLVLARGVGAWDGIIARSGTVRFMRRTLWDKLQILRRSALGKLIPTSLVGGTARQFDPPGSMLRSSALVVRDVSQELVEGGACVASFVAPVDRDVQPRPFSERAEAVSYPALEAASNGAGAMFLNLLDSMAHEHFGTYEDGTPDAFHFNGAGHAELVNTLMESISTHCPETARP